MIEGKIADEDFNGDPEFNTLGQRGIRKYERQSKKKGDEAENDDDKVITTPCYEADAF